MKLDEFPAIDSPVVGAVHDEIVRVCGECLREDFDQAGTGAYARVLAIWLALQEAPQRRGVELADVYQQLSRLADGVEGVSDAVAKQASRVAGRRMPELSSFYTDYVSKSFNKYVRVACQRLGLGLIAVLSQAKGGDRHFLYLKWENKAAHERSASRKRSPGARDPEPFESSVFIAGSVITHPRQFFGRERELTRLFSLLRSHPLQCAAIVGPRRIGKSSLLRYLEKITTAPSRQLRDGQRADWLTKPETYRWVYLDFLERRLKKPEGVFRALLQGVGRPVPDPLDQERFLEEMGACLDRPTIVLMDHIDKALGREGVDENDELLSPEFWEGLRSLASDSGNLAYILASRQKAEQLAERFRVFASPFFNIFGHLVELGPLTEAECRDLIASSPAPFPPDDVIEIITESKRLPFPLQILCSERLHALETPGGDDDWRKKSLKQIECFFPYSTTA